MSRTGKLPSMEELIRMGKKELQKVARTIQRRVGSRLKKLEKAKGLEKSPAKAQLERSGGGIKYGGLDRNELLHEIKRGKDFLEDKTGTVTGAREFYEDVKTALKGANIKPPQTEEEKKKEEERKKKGEEIKDIPWTNEQIDKMFDSFQKAKEEEPAIANINFKYDTFQNINNLIAENPEMSADEISKIILRDYEKQYEESQPMDNGDFVGNQDEEDEEEENGDGFVKLSEEDEERWL